MHLSAARAALNAGDRATALEHVDAALAIDPEFLAAQSLRERLLAPQEAAIPAAPSELPADGAPAPPESRPLVSAEGYAKFEQRAKRRRVDRRTDAARVALQRGRLREAAAALDEVIELDANLPELAELTAEFDDLRRTMAAPHRGPWFAAAAVFAAAVLGASLLEDSGPLASRAILGGVPLMAAPTSVASIPEPIQIEASPAVATTGEHEPARELSLQDDKARRETEFRAAAARATAAAFELASTPEPVSPPRPVTLNLEPRTSTVEPSILSAGPRANVEAPRPNVEARANVEAGPSTAPARPDVMEARLTNPEAVAAPSPTAIAPTVNDELLINQALQRYRHAYEGLDAQSARAVYPAVNEVALARAFGSLSSQSFTFDACDVRLRGGSATATCRGSARYVPKIGSHEPRVEPRVWSFTFAKLGNDWTIENARAER